MSLCLSVSYCSFLFSNSFSNSLLSNYKSCNKHMESGVPIEFPKRRQEPEPMAREGPFVSYNNSMNNII